MGKNFENLKSELYDEISNVKSLKDMPSDFTTRFFGARYNG